jgi:outer membrane receptor protein involved in Fe transport
VLLGAGPAWSQAVHTGTVTGTVMLPDGALSPGVTVSLEGPALARGQWATVSDDRGRFVFLKVPPGTYTATASLSGFNTAQFGDVVITSGSTVPLTFNLEIAPATGEIVVTSEAPLVDTRSSNLDTTFSDAMLEVVPTARDTFYDLTLTAPGMASVGSDESWLPSPSAYGSATNENIFLVDGVNTTNPKGASWGSLVNVNYDTVQEVKILSVGSRAEYGSFSGAAIDVLTKTGGNEFHGSAGYYTMVGDAGDNYTTSYGADWLYSNPDDIITLSPIENWEASATIGGPIIKDKLWFYGGFDRVYTETDTPLWIPIDIYERDIWDLKLTGEFASNHRAWLGFHTEDALGQNWSWGNTWDPTMRYNSADENTTLTAQYQWVATDRNLLGFKYLGFDTDQTPSTPQDVGSPGYINWWKWVGGADIGVGGDFPYVEGSKNHRDTFQADFTHYADDWAGEHEIKFGVQYTTASGDFMGGYFQGYANFAYPYGWWYSYEYFRDAWWVGDETWYYTPTDDVYLPFYNTVNVANPWLTVRESDSTGFFFDDQWVVSDRLTLNLGLRYDRMEARYGAGKVYEFFDDPSDVNNPTVLRDRTGQEVYDFKTWSPRLGFAYDLTGDGKTVLRGHIGRYYMPISVESLNTTGPDMPLTDQDVWWYNIPWSEVDLNGNNWLDFDEIPDATRLLAGRDPDFLWRTGTRNPGWTLQVEPGTTSPYTDQFNLSIQRQLGKDVAIELSYIYKKTQDFLVMQPFDPNTGEFYEYEGRDYTTWTGYDTTVWSIVLDDYNGDGTADWQDAKFVVDNGMDNMKVKNLDSWNGQDVDRTYQGVQLVLNKRYSNRWQAMFAINYTSTDGFYPRPVDQGQYIDIPQQMNTPFGSSANHYQNNISGPALMTPEWMAKLAGSYTIPVIETDFGFRLRYDSGRALFPIQDLAANRYAAWMEEGYSPDMLLLTEWHDFMVADNPDNNDWIPATTIVDLSLNKRFGIGRGMGIGVALDLLNAFNEDSPSSVGFGAGDYGRVYGLVPPRIFRLGLKFDF